MLINMSDLEHEKEKVTICGCKILADVLSRQRSQHFIEFCKVLKKIERFCRYYRSMFIPERFTQSIKRRDRSYQRILDKISPNMLTNGLLPGQYQFSI